MFKKACRIIICKVKAADKVMFSSLKLLFRGGSRTDWNLGKYLTGVGIEDWDVEMLCQSECQLRFAYSRRTGNDD